MTATCTCAIDEDVCPQHKHLNEQAVCGRDHSPTDMGACPRPAAHRAATLIAAQAFVDWINDLPQLSYIERQGQYIPVGYRWELDTPGRKNVRIVMYTPGDHGGSVHAFVNLETGDLLKASGWSAPAKGARGNILTGLDEIKARFDWAGGYLYAR